MHPCFCAWAVLLFLLSTARAADPTPRVLITEILYHPASEDPLDEFIEIFNAGTNNVMLTGWRFTSGIRYTFTNDLFLPPSAYLVVAADLNTFNSKYPEITNVVGNWTGILSNSGETINLDDASGNRVDSVSYADEGDWAVRRSGPLDRNHRGVVWDAPHDGAGPSLELVNLSLSNNHGQNWAASLVSGGTPGQPNSASTTNSPPLILDVAHFPLIPASTESVVVTARLLDEATQGLAATLHWRVDASNPGEFQISSMHDDGLHEDGAPGDGVHAATLPAQPQDTVIDFFVRATDADGLIRTWPAPLIDQDATPVQSANALYQVDDTPFTAARPLYKMIFRELDRAELYTIGHSFNGEQNSDAQFNATLLTLDGTGMECRYLVGVRNRGHASRARQPNSYRLNFRGDQPWKDITAININSQYTHLQHLGSALCLLSGVACFESRPIQLRVNNVNLGNNGPQTYGSTYVITEVMNSDFANHRFPSDSSGNLHRAIRDIPPPDFNWRGENSAAYTNTWFKSSNVSENDWSDLLGMHRILGTNDLFNADAARQVADIDQWLRYLAVMTLFNNRETSPNTGYNDDYYFYAGALDRRFIFLPHDLDTILGQGDTSSPTDSTIFGSSAMPAFQRLFAVPEFLTAYYQTLRRLTDTTFAPATFNPLVDQMLADFVPLDVRDRLRSWMNDRRQYVRSLLPTDLPPDPPTLQLTLSGVPRTITPLRHALITVGGEQVAQFRFALDQQPWSDPLPVHESIQLVGLSPGPHSLLVLGATAANLWQPESRAASASWTVDPSWPGVRLNEILARNDSAAPHERTYPDFIELFNEADATLDLAGLRLTDNPANPGKFTFPAGTLLAPGQFLVLFANDPDGTSGLHTGFALDQDGEGVHLFDAVSRGGALLDQVVFGPQIPDTSIGRLAGGTWFLATPTPAASNTPTPLGPVSTLRINEWLAAGRALYRDDFIELYNPSPQPVALDGLWLTDNLSAAPDRHVVAPLSFIPPNACLAFLADSDVHEGPLHLGFKLAAEQGEIGLFKPDGTPIDRLLYGPQRTDVSQGRQPNGSDTLVDFLVPTPGSLNPGGAPNVTTETVTLVALTNLWRYQADSDLSATAWTLANHDDSNWPIDQSVFHNDSSPLSGPTNTFLTPIPLTAYFRTQFQFDGNPQTARLQFSPFIDDGAVLYLNGTEIYRLRMPDDVPITYQTRASSSVQNARLEAPILLATGTLLPGPNVLAVEVHQASQANSDFAFGLALEAVVQYTNLPASPVVLNEIVAASQSASPNSRPGDWIEIYNTSPNPADISDLSLTDDPAVPRKFIFPPVTIIPGASRLVLACDDLSPASSTNTGFALNRSGDRILLFQRPDAGAATVDSIIFGLQPEGFSLAKIPDGFGPWQLAIPTPTGANLPAALGNPATLRINEWMAQPESGPDWFELYNPQPQPVALEGLFLTDDLVDRQKHLLPPLSFIGAGPGAYVVFLADAQPSQGADHVDFELDAAGDSLGLFSPAGRPIDSLSFGLQSPNVAQGRFPDGADLILSFPNTPSPDHPNWLPLTNIVINELLAHTDPPLEDAIELLNTSESPLDIGGWYLSNSQDDPRRFRIPDGITLPPGAFTVFYEIQFGDPTSARTFTFNSARGDQALLSAADSVDALTGYRAFLSFGPSANKVSFGRHLTSIGADFVAQSHRSFGVDSPTTLESFRTGRGLPNAGPLVGPVVLSELMFFPTPSQGTNDNVLDEFIELQNLLPLSQPLHDPLRPTNTWRIDGGVHFAFPAASILDPAEVVLVVSFNPNTDIAALAAFRIRYGVSPNVRCFGPYDGRLNNSAGTVRLLMPDPPQPSPHPDAGVIPYVLVETIQYRATAPWPQSAAGTGASLQRLSADLYANDPLHWITAQPAPGIPAPANLPLDSDDDGLPDTWERQHFGPINLTLISPADDPDGDGLSNAGEFAAGTIPTDPTSTLALDPPILDPGGWRLQFAAVAGRSYNVEVRSSLSQGLWITLVEVPAVAANTTVEILDPAPQGDTRYYRLRLP